MTMTKKNQQQETQSTQQHTWWPICFGKFLQTIFDVPSAFRVYCILRISTVTLHQYPQQSPKDQHWAHSAPQSVLHATRVAIEKATNAPKFHINAIAIGKSRSHMV